MSSPIPSKRQTPSSLPGLTSLNRSGFDANQSSTSMPQSGRRPQHQGLWPREQQTPEALAAQQKAEIEKWWPIVKTANIKAE